MSTEGPNIPTGVDTPLPQGNGEDLETNTGATAPEESTEAPDTAMAAALTQAMAQAEENSDTPDSENMPENTDTPIEPSVLPEPITDSTDAPAPENTVPTTTETNQTENQLAASGTFSTPETKGFFTGLSSKTKSAMNTLYEGIYKTPGINKLAAKWELARGEKLINRNNEKLVRIKERIESIDQELQAKDAGKAQLEQMIASFEQQGMPGIDQMRLDLGKIEDQKRNLLHAREDNQKYFEKREQKGKIFAEHRDGVANRFIEKFDKKMEPLKTELAEYTDRQGQLEGEGIRLRVKNKNETKENEARRTTLEEYKDMLKTQGLSDSQISKHPAVQENQKVIDAIAQKIELSKAEHEAAVLKHKAKMDAVKARIAKYEAKKKPFTRATEKQPIDLSNPSAPPTERNADTFTAHSFESIYTESSTFKKLESFVDAWNAYIDEQDGDIEENRKIDPETFYRARAYEKETWFEFDDFKDLYLYHLRTEGVAHDETALKGTLERFLKEKLEQS